MFPDDLEQAFAHFRIVPGQAVASTSGGEREKESCDPITIPAVQTVRASARHGRVIDAVADLLARLRIEFVFVGNVARSAWLGSEVSDGSIDVVALMRDEQKNQVATMGSHRGFHLDREEVANSEELDLVPMRFEGLRVHVLLATNALYGRMVSAGVEAAWNERTIRVPTAEDLALLLAVAEDPASEMMTRLPEFNRRIFNQRLVSIGLPHLAVAE